MEGEKCEGVWDRCMRGELWAGEAGTKEFLFTKYPGGKRSPLLFQEPGNHILGKLVNQ